MRRVPELSLVIAVSLSLLASATAAPAYLSNLTVDKCLAGKLKIVGKGAAAYIKCHSKNTANPDAAAFNGCKTKVSGKIQVGFTKVEVKHPGCPGGTGDGSARDADSATYADETNADVGNAAGKCDAAKQKCVGKYVAKIMGCYAKAAKTSGAVDNAAGGCTDKALQKLADITKGCLAKAAAQSDCSNAGTQQGTLQPAADSFSLAQSCALDPANAGCPTPTPTTTPTPTPLPCGTFLTKWGSGGSASGQFAAPRNVAVDASGNVFVADTNNNRIQEFDNTGTFLTTWGSAGSGTGQFNGPFGIAVDGGGDVFVSESNNNRIQKFDNTGTFLTTWGSVGSGDGQFNIPSGIAVDGSGNVFVADLGNNRIQKFDNTGTFLTKWGSSGSGNGQFAGGLGIAVDGSGNVFVVERDNTRVQVFDNTGTFLSKWGSAGSGDGQFNAPRGVGVDGSGNVFVADTGNSRIQKFDNTGIFLTKWGSAGSGDGQFNFDNGVGVDGSGSVFVADSNNNRIQKFACAPSGTCPTTYQFTATGSNADYDLGWGGQGHDNDAPSMIRLALGVSGCASATPPCGQCTVSGPIANAGGTPFANRRCTNDTSVQCTSNAACGAGTCEYWFGPPHPVAGGGFSVCLTTQIGGSVTGTVNADTGAASFAMSQTWRWYLSGSLADPCPRCVGGVCSGGDRNGLACTVNGTSAEFGDDVSFDCPPPSSALLGTLPVDGSLTTGTKSRTLSAASPSCRGASFTADKCFCDTCNNAAATPCAANADCPLGGICGGKRCLSGTNAGAPCTNASECPPSSGCGVPGLATAPNGCDDSTCTPNSPPDNDSTNEGTCAAGPFETACALERYRGCNSNSDCPMPGDTCSGGHNLECFTDNGALGATVSAAGVASTTAPTFVGLACGGPTSDPLINQGGFPGLLRFTIPGAAVLH